MAGIFIYYSLRSLLEMDQALEKDNTKGLMWAIFLLIIVPWCYIISRTAYEYAQEALPKKKDDDSGAYPD